MDELTIGAALNRAHHNERPAVWLAPVEELVFGEVSQSKQPLTARELCLAFGWDESRVNAINKIALVLLEHRLIVRLQGGEGKAYRYAEARPAGYARYRLARLQEEMQVHWDEMEEAAGNPEAELLARSIFEAMEEEERGLLAVIRATWNQESGVRDQKSEVRGQGGCDVAQG